MRGAHSARRQGISCEASTRKQPPETPQQRVADLPPNRFYQSDNRGRFFDLHVDIDIRRVTLWRANQNALHRTIAGQLDASRHERTFVCDDGRYFVFRPNGHGRYWDKKTSRAIYPGGIYWGRGNWTYVAWFPEPYEEEDDSDDDNDDDSGDDSDD